MKRHLFTRELFRSRLIAIGHTVLFAYLLSLLWQLNHRVLWLLITLSLCFTFWLCVACYNIRARYQEFRFTIGATKRYLEAQRAVNEGVSDSDMLPEGRDYCFDCAAEGLQVEAQFVVAAGPQGQKKPVCMMHARAKALQNAEQSEKAKEMAA